METNKLFTWENKMMVKLLALIEVVGGLNGVISSLLYLLPNASENKLSIIIILNLYILVCIAGILLYKKRLLGYKLSFIVNALQVIYFLFNGILYYFASLVSFYLMINYEASLVFELEFGGKASIGYIDSNATEVGLNIIPIIIILILFALYNERKKVI
ncbi:MAG: hypothetical protein CMF23_03835 [Ignavibacteriae bacterium]|nr:hypothetical protein [Ignavibacteriota bacterium]